MRAHGECPDCGEPNKVIGTGSAGLLLDMQHCERGIELHKLAMYLCQAAVRNCGH